MKPFTKIASLIFAVVAVGHLIRLLVQFRVTLGSHHLPMWTSIFGLIIPAIISWRLWKESNR